MTRLMVALLFLAPNLSPPRAISAEPLASGNDRQTIVVLGDSLAAGYGLDLSEAFPALLQKKIEAVGLKFSVVNAGISGDTSAGGLRRID